jgi:nicotinamide-nucleotide amidase
VEAEAAELTAAAARLHRQLSQRAETVATAESLTGGLVGAVLTGVPGASATYRGGLVVYATDLKASLAGVDPALLAATGPVAPEVAAALAAGARIRLGATWGVGLTGVAGPDPQDGQPVGTTYVAVAGPVGEPVVASLRLAGGRAEIRRAAAAAALRLLTDRLAAGE